jgi:hypothetical protein
MNWPTRTTARTTFDDDVALRDGGRVADVTPPVAGVVASVGTSDATLDSRAVSVTGSL